MPLSPARPMRRKARRSPPLTLLAAALLPLGLAACGGSGSSASQFPPPCPARSILPEGGDLRVWGPRGRDITDQVLDGRIQGMNGSCAPGGPFATVVKVAPTFRFIRGPAAPGRVADVPWFIAVTENGQVLDQQAYNLRVTFPPNTDEVGLVSDPITLRLPTASTKSAAADSVWISVQLTPAQMAENRANPRP
jgi:hypothetical protein